MKVLNQDMKKHLESKFIEIFGKSNLKQQTAHIIEKIIKMRYIGAGILQNTVPKSRENTERVREFIKILWTFACR
jgi:hypothetical protein